jgi:hypothetical protein
MTFPWASQKENPIRHEKKNSSPLSRFSKIALDCSYEEAMQLILSPKGEKARDFGREFSQTTISRRFCVLCSGYVGLMPGEAKHGDLVAAFFGAQVLFAIRPLPTDEKGSLQYQLVGVCYVYDIMNGQVMELGWKLRILCWCR